MKIGRFDSKAMGQTLVWSRNTKAVCFVLWRSEERPRLAFPRSMD